MNVRRPCRGKAHRPHSEKGIKMAQTNDVYWLTSSADEVALDETQKFWKELIREGQWTNLDAGFTLKVDRDRLGLWARNFADMAETGIRVPVPWGHSYDPRDNAGFVEELELRDDALWGLLSIPNPEDAEKLGSTVWSVSVSINTNFVDGSGREWGEVIEHVALTNYPVVTDQAAFVQAAARNGNERQAIMLERAERRPADPPPGSQNSELTNRLYQLELERAEREVDEALRLGKFTRPAAEALRRLVAAGVERTYSFDSAGGSGVDFARIALDIIANTLAGSAVDLAERTRLHPMPDRSSGQMTDARAAQLARENKKLAKVS